MADVILVEPIVGLLDNIKTAPGLPLSLLTAAKYVAKEFKVKLIDQRLDDNWRQTLKKELKKKPILVGTTAMLGPQVEYARNVLGMKDANTTEISCNTKYPVIHVMPDQVKKLLHKDYGGTMRLGAWECQLLDESKVKKLYGKSRITERHRHRFEFNNDFRKNFEINGLLISGTSPDGKLVEIIELKDHPFFIGTQFHPELKSRPLSPHPLFMGFIKAAAEINIRQQMRTSFPHLKK